MDDEIIDCIERCVARLAAAIAGSDDGDADCALSLARAVSGGLDDIAAELSRFADQAERIADALEAGSRPNDPTHVPPTPHGTRGQLVAAIGNGANGGTP
jgi:hypothetical protein